MGKKNGSYINTHVRPPPANDFERMLDAFHDSIAPEVERNVQEALATLGDDFLADFTGSGGEQPPKVAGRRDAVGADAEQRQATRRPVKQHPHLRLAEILPDGLGDADGLDGERAAGEPARPVPGGDDAGHGARLGSAPPEAAGLHDGRPGDPARDGAVQGGGEVLGVEHGSEGGGAFPQPRGLQESGAGSSTDERPEPTAAEDVHHARCGHDDLQRFQRDERVGRHPGTFYLALSGGGHVVTGWMSAAAFERHLAPLGLVQHEDGWVSGWTHELKPRLDENGHSIQPTPEQLRELGAAVLAAWLDPEGCEGE